jgi:hypothetical protein
MPGLEQQRSEQTRLPDNAPRRRGLVETSGSGRRQWHCRLAGVRDRAVDRPQLERGWGGDRGVIGTPSTSLGFWLLLLPLLLGDLVLQTTEFSTFDHEHVIRSG